MIDFAKELKVTISTGKVVVGSRRTLKLLYHGKPKLIILAGNCPDHIKAELKKAAEAAGIPIYTYPGSSWDLGALCGKPFVVAALSILDPGESEILKLAEG